MNYNFRIGYIETRIYQSTYHGPLDFDITGLYCTAFKVFRIVNLAMLFIGTWLKSYVKRFMPEFDQANLAAHTSFVV